MHIQVLIEEIEQKRVSKDGFLVAFVSGIYSMVADCFCVVYMY